MKTIITHFFNEEYLLPFWLNHHKKFFDHGILVNYKSTDKSIDIIKEICPTWDIVDSKNEYFSAQLVDNEIKKIEDGLNGFKITLNVTEFILGDFNMLDRITINTQFLIPSYVMVDNMGFDNEKVYTDLIIEKPFGIDTTIPFEYTKLSIDDLTNLSKVYNIGAILRNPFEMRRGRSLHNFRVNYPLGRHFPGYNTKDFIILWYGFSPFNDENIKRKTQIQTKMPDSDKSLRLGFEHMVDKNTLMSIFEVFDL